MSDDEEVASYGYPRSLFSLYSFFFNRFIILFFFFLLFFFFFIFFCFFFHLFLFLLFFFFSSFSFFFLLFLLLLRPLLFIFFFFLFFHFFLVFVADKATYKSLCRSVVRLVGRLVTFYFCCIFELFEGKEVQIWVFHGC